ncbi:MAG: 2-phospho-L-lactate guanylyltransferase [Nitrososphaeraceae archaeon]
MKTLAIIPVKNLDYAKSRLTSVLDDEQRINLVKLLLLSSIKELKKSECIKKIIIVSNDNEIENIAYDHQVDYINEHNNNGVNYAVSQADFISKEFDFDADIIIPHDLPLLTVEDIDRICKISNKYDKCVVICPSERLDGTNIMLRKPPKIIDTYYDNNSYYNHIKIATNLRIKIIELMLKNIMRDIDTADDLIKLSEIDKFRFLLNEINFDFKSI